MSKVRSLSLNGKYDLRAHMGIDVRKLHY